MARAGFPLQTFSKGCICIGEQSFFFFLIFFSFGVEIAVNFSPPNVFFFRQNPKSINGVFTVQNPCQGNKFGILYGSKDAKLFHFILMSNTKLILEPN